jgi:hypothetical protein
MNVNNVTALIFRSVLISNILLYGSHSWADSNKDFNTWQNTLAPLYLWGVSMSGTMTSGPVTAPLEIEFSDAVADLEGIFTLHYEGAKGNWGVIVDYSFLNLTPSAEIPGTPAARRDQAATCWLVELGNGDKFLFDVGTGSMVNVAALMIPYDFLDKVFLTHLHTDHWGDLATL